MTERQLHIRAYRAARGAGLDSDAANAVADKVVERCLTNTPSLHDSHARIDPLVVDRITRRISLGACLSNPNTLLIGRLRRQKRQ